ncbi:RNA_pol_Rpb2_6 domain-containing protein/RNA_pol_Rpb2_7 domain-containing protein/RNA_pol_Rpb2_2 domain-containing protein/RNA_pol_Rpb2_1 domain-containing protein/RNA_pol_Rpb2_3 domain-containing protein/RNA_pol_Rpa2_4 domain-containing protein [Cephalotus follicularis]|uniref:DNA-directed RNA polymerase subunit beta n=1 Tax=Cephalotus follicularis TaxID=3775 RepID=A0A1Q3CM06_CEPFO|nr:RNA_pol_Rpb2_6 domain-containing protein/RNA_pol_Rpb2_7 domain-containing protein/RNA_pol_Rpb2_2 domain-containing protein/RNA_pol_Rpb2_1 domain-containing protein/RNA_pol_Rpb2_3 domain-containing protein/RNA_pol_Rpa2_4 domain-containing protein [Cephalotus follicularis]
MKKMGKQSGVAADYSALHELVKPHIDSFDYMVDKGLEEIFRSIKPVQVFDSFENKKLRIFLDKPEIFKPLRGGSKGMSEALLPFECRQAKISYTAKFTADVLLQYDDGPPIRESINFGQFPIMLRSKLCHFRNASPQKLVSCKEEASEMGGYFILNGLERVVRLLILPKQNYPMSMVRNSFRDRREGYTDKAVVIRCVRGDQSSVTVKLYYLRNGTARLGFWIQGREYLLPVGIVLKALVDTTDREIYANLTCCYSEKYKKGKGIVGTHLIGERAKIILDEVRDLSLFTHIQCLQHIGEHFQAVMQGLENENYSVVADAVLRAYIFVHLDNNYDKFNLLIFMVQKLFSLIDQTSVPDNPDSLQNQDVLLPGHLITIYLKEKLEDWLQKAIKSLEDEINNKNNKFNIRDVNNVKKVIEKGSTQISLAVENMLKTGRLVTQTGLDMQQRAGYTVQAERLNFLRFISFFRSVHRGASFAGLRTTSVRKLLPESWGFLCPVHTPDGEPCGLLNHMTCTCRVASYYDSQGNMRDFLKVRTSILDVLIGVGMTSSLPKLILAGPPVVLPVLLDGRVVGVIPTSEVEKVVAYLRRLKVSTASLIPDDLEVGYVPLSMGGAYPGLYLFTSPSRFIRPVKNISLPPEESQNIELIGPFEQVFMEIKCPDGGDGGTSNDFPATHEEIHPTGMLSVVANLTPWSDHNQSPRNMYQCQMGKQTMAFSSQAIQFRADQKLYHLQTPQSPIVRTSAYTKYSMDEYPTGTNAIVAVLAYTGYDMEDAMILNKSSVERGMCHGQIYQTETIDLSEMGRSSQGKRIFKRNNDDKSLHSLIDSDGLPYIGQMIHPNEPYCSFVNKVTNSKFTSKRKGTEPVYVDYVAVDTKNKDDLEKVNIRFRHPRNPVIGDKFSSRHGQKGVCSQLWPDIDMPFSGITGMRPDLIINPHAFPSRMTIAMLLESVAAKGGSLFGEFMDATPFGENGSKSQSLVDELGEMLKIKGFNYHGVEVLYSGVYGTELSCEIFIGPVYYQRLRHMVSDKYQVRSTGRVDQVTRQPIKGRKVGGGIRFGEMERDAMLAHGAAYLLHDRLHTCSDYHIADVCALCGSILTTSFIQQQKHAAREIGGLPPGRAPKKVICHACQTNRGMETVAMPYVFRYLAAELAAMNIKMSLQLSNATGT